MKLKIILFIVAFTHIFFLSFGQKHKDAKNYQLVKSKIRSLDAIWYKAIDSSGIVLKGNKNEREFDVFDESGNITEEYNYYATPTLSNKQILKFDKNNNVKEIKFYDASGISSNKQVFVYDKLGKEIETKHFYPDSSIVDDSTITKYIGDIGVMTEYRWTEYYKAFRIYIIDTFKLDKVGNCIETFYYSNNEPDCKYKNTYDSKGNLIECDKDSVRMGDVTTKSIYKYDESGNVVSITETSRSGQRVSNYKYEFDVKGNWVKQIEIDDGKPTCILERVIVYR
jgi:hypothetical protein